MKYIGVDLGTSSVKIILINEKGVIEKKVKREYPLLIPQDGYSEQDPKEWYDKTIDGLKELACGCENDIAGIGIAGQMHGLVTLDANDEPIRPAILWNDGRSSKETDYLNNEIGKDKLVAYTGNIAFAGFTAPKILWMKNNEKDKFDRIKKIMLPKDYLVYRLTGVFSTDYSDAAGMLLLDVEKKCWSKEMCDICSIDVSMLPKLYESYDVVGSVKKDILEQLGIKRDVKVVAGAGDNAGSAIGTGTTQDGRCNISIGTSGTVFISTDSYKKVSNNTIHNFCHANGKYHLMGCILSAASANQWFISDILGTKEYDKERAAISLSDLGENKVTFLPYLMGDRTPINDVSARGVFLGMSLDTKRHHMVEAVLEGVTYALRDSLELAREAGVVIKKATLVGGGAVSEIWQHIISDIMNIDIEILETNEGPSLGGAILAAYALGEFKSLDEAANSINKVVKVVKPDNERVLKYEKGYKKYKSIYPALKGIFEIH